MKTRLATLSLLILVGCVTPQTISSPEAPPSAPEEESPIMDRLGVRCHLVRRVGSHIKRRLCTTAEERATVRINWRRVMNDSLRARDVP
ncbi:MAG: hypothetical protein AAFZ18_14565 [Myxococcota bacterium]